MSTVNGAWRGPNIVKDGLVLYLDAGSPNSYYSATAATTWKDISGNGNNSTLINGPTYSGSNGGVITFDGTNDYAEITTRYTALEFQPTQKYSAFVWFRGPALFNGGAIIANMQDSLPYYGWDLWFNHASLPNTIAAHLISNWSTSAVKIAVTYNYTDNQNKWIYFGYTYNGSCPTNSTDALNSMDFYWTGSLYTAGKQLNVGTKFNASTDTVAYNSSQRFRVASRWLSGASSNQIPATIASVHVYNRALTATEVLQNYNATKARFGL